MKPTAPLALALCLTLPFSAFSQQPATPGTTPFTDPANLRGERVSPTNGHELPIDRDALGLAQLLRRLNTRASILNIVAHPDDEDGGMLTLYSRGLGARVADLSLTRGEGGQNYVTGDFEDALGLIRTQELLSNDRYTGVTQFFGTEVDFGFSKTKEEAFAKWTHERVLYDAVRAIRLYRPLVITATFIGNVTDGHGQHQVSGEIAQEAFKAAADPNVFPDQIAEGLLPWQALKIYARVPFADINSKGVFDYATGQYVPARFTNYVTGKVTTTKPPADVTVPEGSNDPLLTVAAANPSDISSTLAANPTTPLSYIQFGRIGLSLQRSQISKNMTLPVAGFFNSGYTLYGSVLCNAPANARVPSSSPQNCHPEQAQRAEGPATKPAPPQNSSASSPQLASSNQVPQGFSLVAFSPDNKQVHRVFKPVAFHPDNEQVPRGFSLGSHGPSSEPGFSPEGMPSSSVLYKPVILSEAARAFASSAAEGPATKPASPQSSAPFSPQSLTTQPNFFTGIDTSIEGIATLAPAAFPPNQLSEVARAITTATNHFDPAHPDAIAPDLANALSNLDKLMASVENWNGDPTQKANALHELCIKRIQLNDALVLSLGIHVDATMLSAQNDVTAATTPSIQVTVSADAPAQLSYSHTAILDDQLKSASGPDTSHMIVDYRSEPLPAGKPILKDVSLNSTGTKDVTRPYFLRGSIEQPVYKLIDSNLRNAPSSPPALTAVTYINYTYTGLGPHMGLPLTIARVVHDGPQPISIIPPVSIASLPTATVLPNGQTTAQLTATLRTDATTSANINVQSPHNWTIEAKAAGAKSVNFFLHPTAPITGPQLFHVTAQTPDHHTYTEGFRSVGYPGLIYTNYYTPATTRVVPVDLKLPAHVRIAYLPGTGDAVPESLASIGLAPTMITVADLTPTKLSNFDTVILGVRAYTANPNLHGAPSQSLLDFARNGGNVLVQYETSGLTSADTPYPLSLGGGEKVVDETAPVTLLGPSTNGYPEPSGSGLIAAEKKGVLTPGYALLNIPNKITSADFNNWVEERGHGFLESWDPHYIALTDTHDPGGPETAAQVPQRGGLITVQVGKGRWTYCAFALYRQLPEAVPGAFRLFVNLITPTH
jgi:LmbE family N-acetylglucosaminyl deacetylase